MCERWRRSGAGARTEVARNQVKFGGAGAGRLRADDIDGGEVLIEGGTRFVEAGAHEDLDDHRAAGRERVAGEVECGIEKFARPRLVTFGDAGEFGREIAGDQRGAALKFFDNGGAHGGVAN